MVQIHIAMIVMVHRFQYKADCETETFIVCVVSQCTIVVREENCITLDGSCVDHWKTLVRVVTLNRG